MELRSYIICPPLRHSKIFMFRSFVSLIDQILIFVNELL